MSQAALSAHPSFVPNAGRQLRVVDSRQAENVPLVGYLVLAPQGTPPADLFAPSVTVSRVDPAQLIADRLPPPTGQAARQEATLLAPVTAGAPDDRLSGTDARPDGSASTSAPRRGLRIDPERHLALLDDEELDLTYLEFALLSYLVSRPHLAHSRTALVSEVWGYDYPGDGRTVDVHIARLRRKLGPTRRASIVTVRRVGYKFVPWTD